MDFVGEADSVAKYFPRYQPFADLDGHGTLVASIVASNAMVAAGVTT
ncbi:MAG TPA: hypothetical protein VHJ69_02875 [Gemmatimonadales bacterium]|nr:hypothetical protein [Gemmatimonadales bacterium]